MSRAYDDSSSQYSYVNQTPVSDAPFTMACWFKSDDATAVQCLMFVGDKDSDVQYHNLIAHGGAVGDPICVQSRDSGGTGTALTTTGYSVLTWHHACAVFAANNDRRAFIDGGSKGTDSGARSPSGLDRVAIGVLGRPSPTFYTSGVIAEAAIWSAALTDDEVALLAKGFSPLFIRPQNLVAYWPLIRKGSSVDNIELVGKYNLIDVNSPGNAVHYSTIRPAPCLGCFWTESVGYYRIYRGQDGIIDYDHLQAAMALGAAQVTVPNQDLPPSTIWHYVRRQLTVCGLESPDSPVCIVRIADNGEMIGNAPNAPVNLGIEGVAGGSLRLRWRYIPLDEEASPTGFHIYMDSGAGFDFDTPTATVSYGLGGTGEFSWTSDPLSDGQMYRFCVRSYAAGGESQNADYVAMEADATGPAAITGLQASWAEKT